MTMRPDEYPEGKCPTCACSRRDPVQTQVGEWRPQTVVLHDDPHCARCYEIIEWVDAEPERAEIPGQGTLL